MNNLMPLHGLTMVLVHCINICIITFNFSTIDHAFIKLEPDKVLLRSNSRLIGFVSGEKAIRPC